MTINKITGEILDDNTAATNELILKNEIGDIITDEFYEKLEQSAQIESWFKQWHNKNDAIIKEIMEQAGVKSIETNSVLLNYISEHIRKGFDVKKFKAEHQELYKEYETEQTVGSHIRIKLKEA